jgi:hypothetical protein
VLGLAAATPAGAGNDYDFGDVRLAPLADPVQVTYPAGAAPSALKLGEVVAAIAPSRDWRVVSQSDGRMELERNVRNKHEMRVALLYDERGFRLRYVASENLMYRDFQRGAARSSRPQSPRASASPRRRSRASRRWKAWTRCLICARTGASRTRSSSTG